MQKTVEILPATKMLGDYVAKLRYEDIPSDIRERIKIDFLDMMGVGLFGSTLPWVQVAVDLWKEWGGKKESTVWGRGFKLPSAHAVLANTHAVNSFEFDDTYVRGGFGVHPGNNVVPAAIALSEVEGSVTGKEFLTAMVAGHEVSVRIVAGLGKGTRGFYFTPIGSTFGAAATASKILGLDGSETANALGCAGVYVGGVLTIPPNSMAKRIVAARGAQGGVMAAVLAKRGFTGPINVVEAKQGGFLSAFSDNPNVPRIVEDLGRKYLCSDLHAKRFPTCTSIHAPLEATMQLVKEHEIRPENIERINVKTTAGALRNTIGFEVDTVAAAQMSLPYSVAVAFMDQEISVDQFTEKRITDPKVKALAKLVNAEGDPELDKMWITQTGTAAGPGKVEVVMRDGSTLRSNLVPEATRMTYEEIEQKFRKLASKALTKKRAEEILQLVNKIESAPNVVKIGRLLS